ncbi:MAG: matrixin family metalloprotease [Candidatus Melainabacteria bacterium]|nr:matrixin family metalloprotease [Candidatus Melainabacteria bacterium]
MSSQTLRISLASLVSVYLASPALAADVSKERKDKAVDLANQGVQFLQAENAQKSAELLWQAAALDPNQADIQYDLGLSFAMLKRYKEAWQCFQKAVILDPKMANAWIQLAQAYAFCGDLKRATAMVEDNKKRFPQDAAALAINEELRKKLARWTASTTNAGIDSQSLETIRQEAAAAPRDKQKKSHYAWALTKAKDYKNALLQYKSLIAEEPSNADYLKGMMWCQTLAGDLEGLQASRQMYVDRFPKASDVSTIKDEIKYYADDFKRIRAQEAGKANESDKDYRVYGPERMPVKVCVPDIWRSKIVWSAGGAPAKDGTDYAKLVEQAFNAWGDASGGVLKFRFVPLPTDSDLSCEWTDDKSKLVHSFASGVTVGGTNSSGQRTSKIYLLIKSGDKTFDKSAFYTTALHEIGHSLGLGHSSSPSDVMYFASSSATDLSANDRSRMRALYCR